MLLLVVADVVEMPQGFDAGGVHVFLRGRRAVAARGVFAEIVNDGAGRGHRLQMIVEAEAREFDDAKLFAQDALGIVALKDPSLDAGFHATQAFQKRSLGGFEKLLRPGKQSFPRAKQLQLVAKSVLSVGPGKLGGLKFTGGKIDKGEADGRARGMFGDGSEETIFAGVEKGDVGGGTRPDDAHDFAADQILAS